MIYLVCTTLENGLYPKIVESKYMLLRLLFVMAKHLVCLSYHSDEHNTFPEVHSLMNKIHSSPDRSEWLNEMLKYAFRVNMVVNLQVSGKTALYILYV